jgi:hypothetical protein
VPDKTPVAVLKFNPLPISGVIDQFLVTDVTVSPNPIGVIGLSTVRIIFLPGWRQYSVKCNG